MCVLAMTSEWRRTDRSGLMVYEDVKKGSYSVQIKDNRNPAEQKHDLPAKDTVPVDVNDGMISQVTFELKRKPRLKVVVLGKKEILVDAIVHARKIQPPPKGSRDVTQAKGVEGKCVDGKIDFGPVASCKYRVGVTLAGLNPEDYEVNEVDIDLASGVEETVTLKVEQVFKKVRFIAYCLATVAKQIWTGDNTQLEEFKKTDAYKNNEHESAYEWWGKKASLLKSWKYKYNGRRNDREDIEARIDTLKAAIARAAAEIASTTGDDELKVFVAPECFFLGRYGAYELDNFGRLIEGLQDLVRGAQWKTWLFVFGTVNGCYRSDGHWEMFNTSPVIKGGFEWDDPSAYTLLRRKQIFSQEIPGAADLMPHGEQDREPLTEDMVALGFGPTENETKLGKHIQSLLNVLASMPSPLVADMTNIPDWEPRRWNALKTEARSDIKSRPMAALVNDLKAKKFGPDKELRRSPRMSQ